MNHRDRHPFDVPDCFGCKALGLAIRARKAPPKKTVHHTDTAVVTETEPNIETQDVHVAMSDAVKPHWKETDG